MKVLSELSARWRTKADVAGRIASHVLNGLGATYAEKARRLLAPDVHSQQTRFSEELKKAVAVS